MTSRLDNLQSGGAARKTARRVKRMTATEAALDAQAQLEWAEEQLAALDLPPPEAFAPTLDPSEMPEAPLEDEFAWYEWKETPSEAPAKPQRQLRLPLIPKRGSWARGY